MSSFRKANIGSTSQVAIQKEDLYFAIVPFPSIFRASFKGVLWCRICITPLFVYSEEPFPQTICNGTLAAAAE